MRCPFVVTCIRYSTVRQPYVPGDFDLEYSMLWGISVRHGLRQTEPRTSGMPLRPCAASMGPSEPLEATRHA